jgi:hypothetical protein
VPVWSRWRLSDGDDGNHGDVQRGTSDDHQPWLDCDWRSAKGHQRLSGAILAAYLHF